MRADQIALQLWTVRRLAAADLRGTLEAVASAGYRSVEVAGLQETSAGELARLFEAAGLVPMGEHVGIDRLRADPAAIAERLETMGCPRLTIPWLPEEERRTRDDVRIFAQGLNGFARDLATRGIRLGYHNHAFEFEPLDGTTIWDVLLAELAAEVEIELDIYWASVGGRDPVELIEQAGPRIRLLHIKDRSPDAQPRDLPAGEGTLDLPGIVQAGRDIGVEWYVAEQDEPRDPLADIARSYRYLASLAG